MPENVLYDPQKPQQPGVPAQPVASSAAPVTSAPVASGFKQRQAQSWTTPAATPTKPSSPPPRPTSSLGLLVKIGFGVLFLIIVIGFVLFILPKLQKPSDTKATLIYWGLWEDKKIMQPIIDEFEKEHPNITIDYEEQDIKQLDSENQQYPKRLLARINSGNGPDIFRYHNNWYPVLSSVLAPMTKDVSSTQAFSSTYFPVVSQDLVHNGAIYGIPLDFDTLSVFVNPDIFQKAGAKVPTDWVGFQTVASDLTVKGPDGTITTSGAALGSIQNVSHGTDILGLLFADSGVDPKDITSSEQNAESALKFFMAFSNGSGATWDDTLPVSLQMFAQGNLAMYIGYSWDIPTIQHLNPALHFVIYPMPTLFGVQRTVASYWVEGVSLKSTHQQAAMEFMQYLNQKDTQQAFYESAGKERGYGEPYARQDLAATLQTNKLLYPFEQQGPVAVSTVFNSDIFDGSIDDTSNAYLTNAVSQMATNNDATSAITTLSNGMKQVVQQYGL